MRAEVVLKDGRRAIIRDAVPEDAAELLHHVQVVGADAIPMSYWFD